MLKSILFWAKKRVIYLFKQLPFVREPVRRYLFRRRWSTELRLLNGVDPSNNDHSSILHLTLNRSASQWVKSVLQRCAVSEGIIHVRWNEMAFNSEYPYLDKLESVEEYEQIFHPKGYLYSAYGGYPKGIPQIEEYKVVLVVRDPRDILVSRYFSKRESHGVPLKVSDKRQDFLMDRAYTQRTSVDEFALEKSSGLRDRFDCYISRLLERHPNVHVTRYEDMVADVEQWLDRLLAYVEFSPPEELRTEIIEEARSIQTKEEDPSAHNRKGRPGDHREKLHSSTIQELNDTFHHVLDRFGYEK